MVVDPGDQNSPAPRSPAISTVMESTVPLTPPVVVEVAHANEEPVLLTGIPLPVCPCWLAVSVRVSTPSNAADRLGFIAVGEEYAVPLVPGAALTASRALAPVAATVAPM